MSAPPFVTIRCPACGSADVRPQAAGRFACQYCQSNFLYTGADDNPGPAPSFGPSSGGRPVAVARSAAVLILGGRVRNAVGEASTLAREVHSQSEVKP